MKCYRQQARSIDSLQGFATENLRQQIVLTAGAPTNLLIDAPRIEFEKIGKGSYQRTVEATLNFQDSTEHGFQMIARDTLSRNHLAMVRKSRESALRGEDPRWTRKYLAPAVLIGTGIAGIISLFYLRS